MNIYTAQYKYNGLDRLDVTVKGQDPLGKSFAPTWEMVMGIKNNTMTQEQYTQRYVKMLSLLIGEVGEVWEDLKSFALSRGSVTLVCFCKPGAFCHRVILARCAATMCWGEYMGER